MILHYLFLFLFLFRRYFDPATTDPQVYIGGNKEASSILIEPQIWATYHLKWTTLARMRTPLSSPDAEPSSEQKLPWCCHYFGAANTSSGRSLTQGLLRSCSNVTFAHFIFQRRDVDDAGYYARDLGQPSRQAASCIEFCCLHAWAERLAGCLAISWLFVGYLAASFPVPGFPRSSLVACPGWWSLDRLSRLTYACNLCLFGEWFRMV